MTDRLQRLLANPHEEGHDNAQNRRPKNERNLYRGFHRRSLLGVRIPDERGRTNSTMPYFPSKSKHAELMADACWLTALPRSTLGRSLFLLQIQADGIDAIPFAGLGWPVVKHVPEVRAAAGTGNLGAHHTVRVVGMGLDGARKCLVKGGPTGTGIKFRG